MKVKAYFFLFIFTAFLVAPVVVNLLSDDGKTVVVAITEEENTKNFKTAFKKDFRLNSDSLSFYYSETKRLKNNCGYIIAAYSIYLDPVSPPPRRA